MEPLSAALDYLTRTRVFDDPAVVCAGKLVFYGPALNLYLFSHIWRNPGGPSKVATLRQ